MSKKIRWGILSTANIGKKRVIPAIQASNNGEVVAVASRNVDRARQFAAEIGGDITAYGSYDEMIAAKDIDAIYNPLPNSEHATWSIKCAEAGIPVLCEKPLASDADEAQSIVDAFADRNVLFAEAFMYRFHPQTQTVKKMVDDGAVGDVQVLNGTFTFRIGDEGNIRLSKDLAGGALMDVGCYPVNMMRFMTGEEPINIEALARVGEQSQVDETLVGLLEFPSGILGHLDCGLRSQFTHSYEIRGSHGRILVQEGFGIDPTRPTTIKYWHDDAYEEISVLPANSYTIMAEDFADSLLNHRAPKFHPQDAVENMRVIDRLLAAAGVR
jgi:predicted dehydrogenase